VAQKKAYSRYFIILQQDENGYSLASDKLPSGYTKLETKNDKCKISYYVQNLKKEHEPYYMALVCNKKDAKKLIKLGMMNIDDYGRAEITHEYGVDNIAGSNIPVDMVTGAAIVKFVDTNIISVMSGFSTTDIPSDWKGYRVIDMMRQAEDKNEKVTEIKESLEEVKEEKDEDIKEENRESKKENTKKEASKEEKNIFEEYEKKIEETKASVQIEEVRDDNQIQTTEEPTEMTQERAETIEIQVEETNTDEQVEKDILNSDETRNKEKCKDKDKHDDHHEHEDNDHKCCHDDEHECKHHHKDKDEHEHDNDHNHDHEHKDNDHKHEHEPEEDYPNGTVGDFFKALAEEFEEVKDECAEIKKCKWYKVPVKNLDELCNQTNYNKYTVVYYPMIRYYPYIKNHGYYLLGYKYDLSGKMKYLVYGIPGKKCKTEQPYGGKSGFVTWVPVKPGAEKDDDMGHWLMFYDFRTSTIVIPVK
jgi:hypothetical protein